jgi:2-polyprenyl-6-hydroxyphenyl methylase / 3-demethylubiquinone-9 3-methyltransferase
MNTLNIDPAEIAKFEALAARWWDTHSEFKPLHDINPLRLRYIDERAHIKDKKILDVGCGGGILSESMAQMGATVTAIDMGKAPLSVAKLHAMETGVEIDYQQITVEQLAEQQPGMFDVVTCMEMLEHVPDPASIVCACSRLVKPGGQVFFSTINRNPKAWLLAVVGAEYILDMLPRGTHDYNKFIKPSELDSSARQCALQLQDITGMTYNPLTKIYKLGHDVDVNYMAHYTRDV